jgi:hypothetical protein
MVTHPVGLDFFQAEIRSTAKKSLMATYGRVSISKGNRMKAVSFTTLED